MIEQYGQIVNELVVSVKANELCDDYQSRRLLAQTIYFATYFNRHNKHCIEIIEQEPCL